MSFSVTGAPKGVGCRVAASRPQTPQNRFKKKNVDTIVLNVLRDLPFSRNEPLKSADD